MCDQAEVSAERLETAHIWAHAAVAMGSMRRRSGSSGRCFQGARRRRVLGEEHPAAIPATLTSASNLALSLSGQGKYADAERISREVFGVYMRVQDEEHSATLTSTGNLAASLSGQGKYADAERIQREVLGTRRRVLATARRGASRHAGECGQSGGVALGPREVR